MSDLHECQEGFECNEGKLYAYCSACAHDGGCGCMSFSVGQCECYCHRTRLDKRWKKQKAEKDAEAASFEAAINSGRYFA